MTNEPTKPKVSLRGWYDITYSPDEGIFYSTVLADNYRDEKVSPSFQTSAEAGKWARANGGTKKINWND